MPRIVAIVSITKNRRITIPPIVAQQLNIEDGDLLQLIDNDGRIEITKG